MAKRQKRKNKDIPVKKRLCAMADGLWSNAVRSDWNWRCAVCGNRTCEAHHLVPRQHELFRYELRNGIALCAHHHQFNTDMSPHQNAAGWMEWLHDHHPNVAEWYEAAVINRDRFEGIKNEQYYIETIQRFREYVDPDDFVRIVGIRFSEYLAAEERMEG